MTGSAQGIGKEFTLALAEAGADVAIIDINLDTAQASAKEISQTTEQKVIALKADITDPEDVNDVVDKIVEEFGTIDIAFNTSLQLFKPLKT